MQTKWITSMEVFAPLIMPILSIVHPKVIAEIGAAEGGHTRVLYEFLKNVSGKLITIDPFPRGSFVEWVQASSSIVTHFSEFSLNCIAKAGAADVWFIDGDHNWYTVFNELRLIDASAQQHNLPALIFMHDVSWPCARRDMYYDPCHIPPEFVQPHSNKLGVTLEASLSPIGGLKGPHWALQEGGSRNGVLTAVEDFLQLTGTQYHWFKIPALLGLGILVDKNHPLMRIIAEFYKPYHNNPVMEIVERDRVSQYLTAVALSEQSKELLQ